MALPPGEFRFFDSSGQMLTSAETQVISNNLEVEILESLERREHTVVDCNFFNEVLDDLPNHKIRVLRSKFLNQRATRRE